MLSHKLGDTRAMSVVDQGAGRLRNLSALATAFGCVVVVDTRRQLSRHQHLYGARQRILDVVRGDQEGWAQLRALSTQAFGRTRLDMDVVFSVCVYDAVPASDRHEIARAAFRNLKPGGTYVVIVPRNDSSVVKRCRAENAYDDGHVFRRHGVWTFYHNYRSSNSLTELLLQVGFELIHDGSRYRHVWLVLQRPEATSS